MGDLKTELTLAELMETMVEDLSDGDKDPAMLRMILQMVQAPTLNLDNNAFNPGFMNIFKDHMRHSIVQRDGDNSLTRATVKRLIKQNNLQRIEQLLTKKVIDLHKVFVDDDEFPVNCCTTVDMLHLLLRYGLDLTKCYNEQVCPLTYVPLCVFVELIQNHQLSIVDWSIRSLDSKSSPNQDKVDYCNRAVQQFRMVHCRLFVAVTDLPIELCNLLCDFIFMPLYKVIKQSHDDEPVNSQLDNPLATSLVGGSIEQFASQLVGMHADDPRLQIPDPVLQPFGQTFINMANNDPQSIVNLFNGFMQQVTL